MSPHLALNPEWNGFPDDAANRQMPPPSITGL